MNLQQRINLLAALGKYMTTGEDIWQAAKQRASQENTWFTPAFIELSVNNIVNNFLQKDKLEGWANEYQLPAENKTQKNTGLVMAGNIPLVGFHDFLCIFISGHRQTIKPSSKDNILIKRLVEQLCKYDSDVKHYISFAEMLKGCDAYIATGSNNSSRYFEYYFNKYPHIIRRNRSSIAVLTGEETEEELGKLADDVYLYFGLGCRNVTKIYVPENYDFVPLLNVFNKYDWLADNHKYKNNYDYQLALLILNKKYYMTNSSLILSENKGYFSPISVLHYAYYTDVESVLEAVKEGSQDIQCVVGQSFIPFGKAQEPGLTDYADGQDTLQFLRGI
jgi:hypothetical protein